MVWAVICRYGGSHEKMVRKVVIWMLSDFKNCYFKEDEKFDEGKLAKEVYMDKRCGSLFFFAKTYSAEKAFR